MKTSLLLLVSLFLLSASKAQTRDASPIAIVQIDKNRVYFLKDNERISPIRMADLLSKQKDSVIVKELKRYNRLMNWSLTWGVGSGAFVGAAIQSDDKNFQIGFLAAGALSFFVGTLQTKKATAHLRRAVERFNQIENARVTDGK